MESESEDLNIGNIGPGILLSYKNPNGFTWSMVLGELCDNSFDAGASRIELEFSAKTLTVTDDGCGCDNIDSMLTLGRHYHRSSTRLGRYGVGLKDAACWLWGTLGVCTTHAGVMRIANVDWEKLANAPTWPRMIQTKVASTAKNGTQLRFERFAKKLPDLDKLARELGYMYGPAILAGRQIRISGPRRQAILVRAWQMPALTQQITEHFEVDGKRVKLVAGIVAEDAVNDRPGFSICHEHRVICNSALRTDGYSTARFCGTLILDNSWRLSRNKTDITDELTDDLKDAVFYRCESLLKQAATQAKYLRNNALESSVTEKIRVMLGKIVGVKEKRKSPTGDQPGTVTPKHTGRNRNPRKNTQPGNKVATQLAGRVRMEWAARNDGLLGSVDLPGAVIYLNSNHERLAQHQKLENDEALADACMVLVTFEEMERQERSKLFQDYSSFMEALSSVMTSQQASQAETTFATN